MKKLIITAALLSLSVFALTGMGGNKEPEPVRPQLGVVDVARLYQESKTGKAGVERLEKLQEEALARLETMQADLKKAQEAKDDATAQRLQVEMQGALYQLQTVMTAEQEKVVATIRATLQESMDAYRADHGMIGLVNSDTMLSYDKALDVTNGVMELLDAHPADFGPLPSLDSPAAPAETPAAESAVPSGDAPAADSAAPAGQSDQAGTK